MKHETSDAASAWSLGEVVPSLTRDDVAGRRADCAGMVWPVHHLQAATGIPFPTKDGLQSRTLQAGEHAGCNEQTIG